MSVCVCVFVCSVVCTRKISALLLAVIAISAAIEDEIFKKSKDCVKNGEKVFCGHGQEQCGKVLDTPHTPKYHIMDKSCDINDPNGPFYDEIHGMYHLFYQDHIHISSNASIGPIWGHAISPDLIRWSHLPVALWNDKYGACMYSS